MGDPCNSATCCGHIAPAFLIASSTCKAKKFHEYFIGSSISLHTDSMGKEINSWVLIMQCGDTDLILCLSTCADILMRHAPLLSGTQEGFRALSSKPRNNKKLPVWQRLHHCLNHQDINENAGAMCCFFFFFFFFLPIHSGKYTSSFSQKQCECKVSVWQLVLTAEQMPGRWTVRGFETGLKKKAELQPLLLCSQTKTISSQEWKH